MIAVPPTQQNFVKLVSSKHAGDLLGHADTRMVETVYARSCDEGVMQHLDFQNKLNSVYAN